MVFVVIILILAWSLSSVIKDLGTAQVLSTLVGGNVNPALLPAIVLCAGRYYLDSHWVILGHFCDFNDVGGACGCRRRRAVVHDHWCGAERWLVW